MVNLLIVESPGKIKKIQQILSDGWRIMASMGHIRQLSHDGEDNLGFDLVGDRVNCRYEPKDSKAKKIIQELKKAAKYAQRVYLATDPDREGETISWHIAQVLGLRHIWRVSFTEITEKAIRYAIANPRSLDTDLINSGQARSCLDKLVGFKGSKLLWRKNIGAKSMGRVQSAVLHLVGDREREITNFKPVDYYSVFVDYAEGFRAFYCGHNNSPSPPKKENNNSESVESTRIFQESEAANLIETARKSAHSIVNLEKNKVSKSPPAPFITSTLQQAAGSKLSFSPDSTMKLAQTLYEKGLITYMRTDSVNLSEEFRLAARSWLENKDPNNVPQTTAKHRSHKNSQEAHEAIRPTNLNYPSSKLRSEIEKNAFKLYVLIWKRAIASQCRSAIFNKTTIISQSGDVLWQAKGQIVEFPGYAKYWQNLSADASLPTVKEGQALNINNAEFEKKRTSPPSRLGEAQLVALMEKKGIGRPSTYSSAIKTIKDRQYVKLSKKKLCPTKLGLEVNSFLGQVFQKLISAEFTASMEQSLDKIACGELNWQKYLTDWNRTYFAPALASAYSLLPPESQARSKTQGKTSITRYICPVCQKSLEQYTYTKEGQEKSLLRCSDPQARRKPNHKKAVFFPTKTGAWWSKDFGELNKGVVTAKIKAKKSKSKAAPKKRPKSIS